MNHYRSRHSPHDRQPESTIFTLESLDPKLDSLVDSISREIANNHSMEAMEKCIRPRRDCEVDPFDDSKDSISQNIQISKFTSSFLFGIGMLGFALSLPSLQIGSIQFDLPFLVISAFCTSIGAGCMMMVHLTHSIPNSRAPSTASHHRLASRFSVSPSRLESQLEWMLGSFGILFLVSAMLVSSAYRRDLLVLPTVFRLGLLGLTCSTISLQFQFLKLLRVRLQRLAEHS